MEVKVMEKVTDRPERAMQCIQVLNEKNFEAALLIAQAAYLKSGYPPAKVVYQWRNYFYFDVVGEDAQEKE